MSGFVSIYKRTGYYSDTKKVISDILYNTYMYIPKKLKFCDSGQMMGESIIK